MFFLNLVLEPKSVKSLSRYRYFVIIKPAKSQLLRYVCLAIVKKKKKLFDDWFLLSLIKNDRKCDFQRKKFKFLIFIFFFLMFPRSVISLVLWWCNWPISVLRPVLEITLDSTSRFITRKHDLRTFEWSTVDL